MTGSIGSSPVGTHSSSNNAGSYATGSFTPTAGKHLIVDGYVGGTADAAGMTCTASANGLTFTKITADTHSLSAHTSLLWVSDQAVPSSPVAMTVTVGVPNDAGTGALIGVFEATGLTAGGASAIRSVSGTPQVGKTLNITAGGTYNCSLPAAPLTTNPLYGSVHSVGTMQAVGAGVIPPSGFTEIWEPADQSAPVLGLEVAKSDSGITSAGPHTWTADGGTQRTRANIYLVEFDTSAAGPPSGTGTGAWSFAGSAVGARTPKATATGTWSFAGTTAAKTTHSGTATGSWSFAGAATGAVPKRGSATGSWSFAGTAVGARTPKATSSGSWSFAGTAAGSRTPKASSTGSWSFTGTASGARTPKASSTGSWTFAGTAAGSRTPKATGAGSWSFEGAAVGSAPAVGMKTGSATGDWAFTGTAAGLITHQGSSTGSWAFASTASGVSHPIGSATGDTTWTGVAVGIKHPVGSSTGTWTWEGAAVGAQPAQVPEGAATGTWTFHGAGEGWTTSSLTQVLNLMVLQISGSELDLSWDAVSNALFYEIERDGVLIDTSRTTSYQDLGLDPGVEYAYRVRAGG